MQVNSNFLIIIGISLVLASCGSLIAKKVSKKDNKVMSENLEKATFAGGCFWCVESGFDGIIGVEKASSGYTDGNRPNPNYEMVSTGVSGYAEAVEVSYDPEQLSYKDLVNHFWKQIDPTDEGGQFADRGSQYRTAIYYHNEEQKKIAEETKAELEKSGKFDKPIVTEILPAKEFYEAEDYHQDYHKKNSAHYSMYRIGSGRAGFLEKIWGSSKPKFVKISGDDTCAIGGGDYCDPKDHQNNKVRSFQDDELSDMQYKVTKENGTEPPFMNEYWNNKKKGIYVDIISGKPLFSSEDKFDSGTGWPSFTKPINDGEILDIKDMSHGMIRTEVRSKAGDAHLGHVFDDGPGPNGKRYCINSASLKFIPEEDLEKEGYGHLKNK